MAATATPLEAQPPAAARDLLDSVISRLRGGNKAFPATRALLLDAFSSDPSGCRRLALELVALLVDGGAPDEAAPAAEPAGAADAADGARHSVLCALILDCAALAVAGKPSGKPPPRAGPDAAALADEALRLGGRMPSILRKTGALCGVALDEPPARQHALRSAAVLLEQGGPALREAALLLAAARASEAELGARAAELLDSLVAQAAWPPAVGFARASLALQRHLVAGCVRANEHKRALGLVRQFGLGPAEDFEHIYVHLELGRAHWLARSGYIDLLHAALRDAADAIFALRADGAPSAPGPAEDEAWPLSLAGTVEYARQLLALMASRGVPLDDSPEPPHAAWLVRRLAPRVPSDEAVGWWGAELEALSRAPAARAPAHRGAKKAVDGVGFLALGLPAASIVDVASEAAVAAMLRAIRADGGRAIGLDSEWRPTGFLVETRCALLQLALPGTVFLIDLRALLARGPDEPAARALDEALASLFADPELTKLAFGLRDEFKTLRASFPRMSAFDARLLRSAVCVQEQHARWRRGAATGAPARPRGGACGADAAEPAAGEGEPGPRLELSGLSAVCTALLGRQLDKVPQMSDWERRPLTAEQRVYAALDAHCLLELHERMIGAASE